MKKFLFTFITLFCLTTAIYGDDDDRQQSNRTSNMRSSSTRSTVNRGGNVVDIRSGYVGNSRFTGGNMRRSGVTNGSMGTGMTRGFVGNGSHGTKRNQSEKNDTTRNK